MDVEDYDYDLSADAIAQTAIEPRDASRLLIAKTLEELPFNKVASLFNPGDVVVVNRTRVRPARLRASRIPTGGAIEVLLTRRIDDERWEALMRPARRLRSGERLAVGSRTLRLVSDPRDGVATVVFEQADDIDDFLAEFGSTPLPPYFTGELEDDERYQTMFATELGSSAAPTAALHFTQGVVDSLADAGVRIAEVTLDVGLDTFRPMGEGPVEGHEIHTERIAVDVATADAINSCKRGGGRVIAVGTTVMRTLESAAGTDGAVAPVSGATSLFITPGYRPRVVDALITNFHAPRTTLLVLISALLGDDWKRVYQHALDVGFRFLSFGDAMFVEVSA